MPDNPYKSTEQPHGEKRSRSTLSILGVILAVTVVLLLLVALLIPARRGGRQASPRNSCLMNMKQIMLGLQNYYEVHGELPPAYTVDEQGNRLHSWRALILPYMEGNTLYRFIDYTKPWDDPANDEAREAYIYTYICPSAPYDDEHLTTYVAVVGPEFVFSGPTPRKWADIADGTSNTIAVVEISHNHAVHWMSPEDVDEDFIMNTEGAFDTNHHDVFIAGYLDGHTEGLEVAMDRSELRKRLTIAGRETIGEDE